MKAITGICDFVPYRGDNGFCIAKLITDEGDKWSAKGEFDFRRGLRYEVSGEEGEDRYGRFLRVLAARMIVPPTTAGIASTLTRFDGIGPAIARKLVDEYGEKTIETLRTADPAAIAARIPRLSVATIEAFRDAYGASEAEFELVSSVRSLIRIERGGDRIARLAIKAWKGMAAQVITENPWRLARLPGIGFPTADQVALALGRDRRSPERMDAGVLHAIDVLRSGGSYSDPRKGWSQTTLGGSTVHRPDDVIGAALGALGLRPQDDELAAEAVETLLREGELVREGDGLMLAADRDAEVAIASALAQRGSRVNVRGNTLPPEWADRLKADQLAAAYTILAGGTAVLTGAPGTGKTFSVQAILAAYSGARVRLAAPTGKAAKRLSEMTGTAASTIHRLLEPRPRGEQEDGTLSFGFERNAENPIEADLIVLDEVSMIGPGLFRDFLAAVRPETDLLLVGDPNQLPSIAPGSVLRDLIASESLPVARLVDIKRQDPGAIITGCHDLMAGRAPQRLDAEDFTFDRSASDAEIAAKIVTAYLDSAQPRPLDRAVPSAELAPVQILAPFRKRGQMSAEALNCAIQAELIRRDAVLPIEGVDRFCLGDRVIQGKNDYERGIVNGDMGAIVGVTTRANGKPDKLVVQFAGYSDGEGRVEIPPRGESCHLTLAYAITVHKSQGSEWPAVIIPVHTSFGGFFDRCLCYTAMSRASEHLTMVGQAEQLAMIAQRTGAQNRRTMLADRLRAEVETIAGL